MIVTCRNCRGEITSRTWNEHTNCSCLISEEPPAGTKLEDQREGRIRCVKCNSVLGRFKWHGAKCMCGRWTFPYISVHKSNTDIMHEEKSTPPEEKQLPEEKLPF
ncbi:uncharacterized protein NEMAJ01_2360 [Nematocida major]|uniref:uncharacterized protein n=1 Tax=Nematocida major TaxID=1912982 RepID=UPI0020084563|nr:uncharacterized protein NEMAJ01_2360 [Nematocida major]KAH9387464.1 hypothetical protein NEMAJ01_2360 [Nematocida major]